VRTLNLGIVAHVDAGKTSLTERLLQVAGVIDEIGRVDHGSTRTDTMALERQRGITIKAAVVSFAVGDLTVNLIDTPGHPDFIAEVDRVLGVLDGAVMVVSAVEGVQAQTHVLLRALQRQRVPFVFFVNKADRGGADPGRVLREIGDRLTPAIAPMVTVSGAGTREASVAPLPPVHLLEPLAEHDDALLAAFADSRPVADDELRRALASQTALGLVHPVFSGSAITGAGVAELVDGITTLLGVSRTAGDCDQAGPPSGTVFKVERGPAGERIGYVRMFGGTLAVRDKLRDPDRTVTAISVFEGGADVRRDQVSAGQIARVWGLGNVRIGDPVGTPPAASSAARFSPPAHQTIVTPRRRDEAAALYAALSQLAEQDPLINLRRDEARDELHVSLYGEVQKEVLEATLAGDFGIEVSFSQTSTICVERPAGSGAAAEFMGSEGNPFRATVGLRVTPWASDDVRFRLGIEPGALPVAFQTAIEETVRSTLQRGLHGWQVIGADVTLTHSGYTPPPPYGWSKWSSSGGDFRNLTPLVLMSALRKAGTTVFEPVQRFHLVIPVDTIGAVLPALGRLGGVPQTQRPRGTMYVVEGEIPAARVSGFERRLPGLARGEGAFESEFARYQQVRGEPPRRNVQVVKDPKR
jgi:ribosomal protection tetracycline resistance protein